MSLCKRGHDLIKTPRGKYGQCIECARLWVKDYRKTHKLEAFGRQIKHHYGVTLEQWNQMFQIQKGLCLGCYKHQSNIKDKFCVDHDHATNKVRGLLCRKCNYTLGLINDSALTLRRLADYLDTHKGASLVTGI